MNIQNCLNAEHSKSNVDKIINYIGQDSDKLNELMACFFSENIRLCQRAAWTVGILGEMYPHLLLPYMDKMIQVFENPKHNALVRNTLRTWQFIDIPSSSQGMVYDKCFNLLINPKSPIAIRVFAMTVCFNISKIIPELKEELILVIKENMVESSPGFYSRGNKVLKALSK